MHWIKAIFQPGHSFRSLMVTKQCWEISDHLTWICIEFIYVIGKKVMFLCSPQSRVARYLLPNLPESYLHSMVKQISDVFVAYSGTVFFFSFS